MPDPYKADPPVSAPAGSRFNQYFLLVSAAVSETSCRSLLHHCSMDQTLVYSRFRAGAVSQRSETVEIEAGMARLSSSSQNCASSKLCTITNTSRYGPLRASSGPTSSSCGGLRPSAEGFFCPLGQKKAYYAVLANFRPFLVFSSNLSTIQ